MKKASQSQSSTLSSSSSKNNNENQSETELELKLQKASNLEQNLSNTTNSSSITNSSSSDTIQRQASQFRIKLCEIYSDILLSNPSFAYRKDISNKLWRSCFYGRISELRNRISKEKNRLKKIIAKQSTLIANTYSRVGGNGNSNNAVFEQEKRVKMAQNVLDTFLQEAVVLYEYLIDQLHGMLIDHSEKSTTQNDDDSSMEGDDDNDDDDDEQNRFHSQNSAITASNNNTNRKTTSTTKTTQQPPSATSNSKIVYVVPTLFRIYIHLGDLHRYSSSYNAAEKVYLKASYLAPGKGNPYNQLAVCAQVNDTAGGANTNAKKNKTGGNGGGGGSHPLPAMALYWYCRSLLASHDAFATSRSNLERLFMANKKWIEESNVQTFADVAKKNNEMKEMGENKEKARVVKSQAKRKFLSHYVDFHGSLLSLLKNCGSSIVKKAGEEKVFCDSVAVDKLILDMDNLVNEFSSVLETSMFGDAFLVKMVCINAFSVWNGFEFQKKATKNEGTINPAMGVSNPATIALMFVVRFASQLCSELEKAIEKGIAKQQEKQGKTFGSIRLVGPLFLLCEFISNECNLKQMRDILSRNANSSLAEKFDQGIEEFWRRVAMVANLVNGNKALLQLIESQDDVGINMLPDDFQSLIRGYTPFLTLDDNFDNGKVNDDMNSSKTAQKVYVTPEEAVDALELYQSQTQQSQSSQRSKKSSTHSSTVTDDRRPEKIEMELKIKLNRFMGFIVKHLGSGELVKSFDGLITSEQDATSMAIDEDPTGDDLGISMDFEEDNFNDNSLTQTQENSEEQNKDVLVYTAAESGKPALLVPGAFLLEEGEEKQKEENYLATKKSSFVNELTMGDGLKEEPMTLANLLDPSSLLENAKNFQQPEIEESKLLAIVNKKMVSNMSNFTVLPPMPSSASEPVAKPPPSVPAVRPPPGFHAMHKPSEIAALPPMPPGMRSLPETGITPLPPPQVHEYLPQTANPFVAPMGYNNGTTSNILPVFNETSYSGSGMQPFSSFMSPNNALGATTNNRQSTDEVNYDYDLFGLRSLGIFTDDRNDAEPNISVDSMFQSPLRTNNETHNPYSYD